MLGPGEYDVNMKRTVRGGYIPHKFSYSEKQPTPGIYHDKRQLVVSVYLWM